MSILKHIALFPTLHGRGTKLLLAMLTIMMMTSFKSPQQGKGSSHENQLKAVFLFNFTQFVQWPTSSFNETEPFVIGVLGKNIFKSYLEKTVEGELVNNRPIVIRYFDKVSPDLHECEILFIEKSFPEINRCLEEVRGKAILTVSDDENFMKKNGMLRFYVESSKIRLEINKNAVGTSGLEISSKLLRLATIHVSQ
jgi:hypothetical protein